MMGGVLVVAIELVGCWVVIESLLQFFLLIFALIYGRSVSLDWALRNSGVKNFFVRHIKLNFKAPFSTLLICNLWLLRCAILALVVLMMFLIVFELVV
ncbi:hypothetical protein HNR48_003742 [Pseudoteredinibacter isoporae]|uniref:Uncharacterized protein n=1 Tax=Pseudoteredinibacter isoporae TaxID=570281 RepID=A0A7X0MXP7_9GAMM|nr:hypothetical protein [Pseudoteredinibacter isoporae]